MENNKISVIIPVYNVEKYISRCLNSILNNSYQNLEVICINDGSTDNSLKLLQEYAKKDDRIVLLDQDNGGISVARNAGLDKATGTYISFVDSDDWIHKDFFKIMMDAIGETDIVHCRYIRCGELISDSEIVNYRNGIVYTSAQTFVPLLKGMCWCMLYKRSVINGIKFPSGVKMCEDKVFTIQALCNAKSVTKLDCKLYYHYINPVSSVYTFGLEVYPAAQAMLKIAKKSQNSFILYDAYTGFLSHRYLNMFDVEAKSIRTQCNQQLKECDILAKQIMPLKERLKLSIMVRFPFIYRLYRIVTDATMLDWERNQKHKKKVSKK